MLPTLTAGALQKLLNEETVENPVLQLLDLKQVISRTPGMILRLNLSDGEICNSGFVLSPQLFDLVHCNTLSHLSIFRLKNYAHSAVYQSGIKNSVIVILDIDILISGTQLKQVLGNINPENVKITDVSLPLISTAPMQQMVQQPVDVNTLSVLMKGVLEKVMSGMAVLNPILQLVEVHNIGSGPNNERYRLCVSDGESSNSLTLLGSKLKNHIKQNMLSSFSVFLVKRYVLNTIHRKGVQKRVMILLDIEVLLPGEQVGGILNTVQSENEKLEVNTITGQMMDLEISPTTVSDENEMLYELFDQLKI